MGELPLMWPATILRWVALACYLLVTALYAGDLLLGRSVASTRRRTILGVGVVSHLGVLVLLGVSLGRLPLGGSLESLGAYAWLVYAFYLVLESKVRESSIGAFVLPVATTLYVVSLFVWRPTVLADSILDSGWFELHAVSIFIAYSAFSIAFCTGIMYLTLARQLERKQTGRLFVRLPSLATLDQVNYRAVAIGFSLLAVGMITGMAWAHSAWGVAWSWEPVQTCALVTWLIYAAYLHARLVAGWQGARVMTLAVMGFFFSLVTYMVASLMMPGKHGF
jgi:cytochrome c-type biogenesis protein CcsB